MRVACSRLLRAYASWLVLGALLPAAASAAIEPGFDLFETDPSATQFSFQDEFTIPAGFFGNGSQPFEGQIAFGGEPLLKFNGLDVGDADTVVHRLQRADLPGPGSTANVPIEIVALHLVSVQPITVRYQGNTETWNVSAGLSAGRPSNGSMSITQTGPAGGTFSSQLFVRPNFTFTRVSDGLQKTLDAGQLPPSTQTEQSLLIQAANVPWRTGCVLPALAVKGLNDGFCPGLTTTGQKQLTVEQGRLAKHGVFPAQPRTEHFKCYSVKPQTPFKQRTVQLTDQFGKLTARLTTPTELCNPARKNNEPFVNRTAHLKCYQGQFTPSFQARRVRIRNQFGQDTLSVQRPFELCVPSLKAKVRRNRPLPNVTGQDPTLTLSHFLCYSAKGAAVPAKQWTFKDQFDTERMTILRPFALCTPVQKNAEPFRHPVRHLVCYQFRLAPRSPAFAPRLVRVRNQFGLETLNVLKPRAVCAPTLKVLATN